MPQSLYYIAVIPPGPIAEEVKSIKQEFASRYNSSRALRSPAHITLQAPFWSDPSSEIPLTEKLKMFCNGRESFRVQLSDFSRFDKRVIFADVTANEKLHQLHKDLMYFLRDKLNFPASGTSLSFHPHMTVAYRDLTPEMFTKAWEEFKLREFKAEFEVKSISLLKHNRKEWDVLEEMLFSNAGL